MATYGPVPHTLRDGATLTLRSPTPDDAPALLDYLDVVRRETDFLMVGPSDEMFTVEREREWIKEQGDGPDCVQIAAWHDGRPVGLAGVKADGPFARVRHRATLGISLLAEWSGRGLGTHLTRELVSWAERHPAILVVRLGVFADNPRAAAVYRKCGFAEEGRLRWAARREDGTLVDELVMSRWVGGESR